MTVISGSEFQILMRDHNGNGEELPKNLVVNGCVNLNCCYSLPDGLVVSGYLDIPGTQITELPDDLVVSGYLCLRNTQITRLPDNLTVGGELNIGLTPIDQLPKNLTVGWSLSVDPKLFDNLPDDLVIGKEIENAFTGERKKRPRNLQVQQMLSWRNGKYIKLLDISSFYEVISRSNESWIVKKIGGSCHTDKFRIKHDRRGVYLVVERII